MMEGYVVIPTWVAWCLLGGLILNAAAQIASIVLTYRKGRRRGWYPAATDL